MDENKVAGELVRIAKELTAASWKSAHPEANVPRQIHGDGDFEDESWHNDAMPRFLHVPSGLYLWADYENPEMSDFADWRLSGKIKRFSVVDKDDRELLDTDDVGKVLRFLKRKVARVAANRVPSAVRRRVDGQMKKHIRRGFDDYDDVFDTVQDILFMDPDVPEEKDGEMDLEILNDWTFEIARAISDELGLA
jgi:hypothetical protein